MMKSIADWIGDWRWAKNMKRARRFRRSLSENQKAKFDDVMQRYMFLNLNAQKHFDGFLMAVKSAMRVE